MTSIRIEIPGPAAGKGRPRFARRGNFVKTYTDAKTASYENLVKLAGQQAMAGAQLIDSPVSVSLDIAVSVPESWSKKKRAAALNGEIQPTTKPDIDNVLKAIADALNGIVWVDDKQIYQVQACKRYAETPGAVLEVWA